MERRGYIHAFAQAVHPAWKACLALLCLANLASSTKIQINYHSSKEMRSRKYHYNDQVGEDIMYIYKQEVMRVVASRKRNCDVRVERRKTSLSFLRSA